MAWGRMGLFVLVILNIEHSRTTLSETQSANTDINFTSSVF